MAHFEWDGESFTLVGDSGAWDLDEIEAIGNREAGLYGVPTETV